MDQATNPGARSRAAAIDPITSPLVTDLYQLTMLQGYWARGMDRVASFELFVRKLPPQRGFLVAAGLELLLDWLETLRFNEAELAWLHRSKLFRPEFVDWLGRVRFRGSVEAMDEGTIFFAGEPILRVTAPIAQAQLIESRLVNQMHLHTLIASKAARSVLAAPGKQLVDFGMRRAHGAEAALAAARAAYLAGFAGSSLVLAGTTLGIPVFGTMAHSFVQAHDDERDAFIAFAEAFPDNAILLIDTYDTEAAARKVVEVAPRLAERGIRVKGVRLDSGDLAGLSRAVRRILDDGGLPDTIIFASGNLDEYRLAALERERAPINGYGVGTSLVTSADAPALDIVYKLQEYDGRARRKRSTGKATWPGRKQVLRYFDGHGHLAHDELALERDHGGDERLLHPVMRDGQRVRPRIPLATIRNYARQSLDQLPPALRSLETHEPGYHVIVGQSVRDLADTVDRAHP
jgi:nicotinate phosphoribosyltransferase